MGLTPDPRTGLISWPKGTDTQLSLYFGTKELACPCMFRSCTIQFVHEDLLKQLDALRSAVGAPIKVNSGYRCQAHQQDLLQKGYPASAGTSQHTLGHAVDVQCANYPELVAQAPTYFMAIGTAHNWLHLDTRADKVRRWTY